MVWFYVIGFVCLIVIGAAFEINAQKNNKTKLLQAIESLESGSPDRDSQLRFMSFITGLSLPYDGYRLALEKAFTILESNLNDEAIQNQFLRFLSRISRWIGISRDDVYKRVLNLLAIDSGPAAKQFVLRVARWHYAKSRKDGKLTIYDEQAIQNDILVHSKS